MMDGNQFQNWFRQSIEVLHDCIEWMMQKTEAKPKKKSERNIGLNSSHEQNK